MACLSPHHETLTDGVGKCSVPMWIAGGPGGFCDREAYGEPPVSRSVWRPHLREYVREDGRYGGYVPALACPAHGGPPAPPATPKDPR